MTIMLTLLFVPIAAAFVWGAFGTWGPDASPVASMMIMGGVTAWMAWSSAAIIWLLWRRLGSLWPLACDAASAAIRIRREGVARTAQQH